jgi:hypothetical protein
MGLSTHGSPSVALLCFDISLLFAYARAAELISCIPPIGIKLPREIPNSGFSDGFPVLITLDIFASSFRVFY